MYQNVDEKQNCGPASALRIKAGMLEGVGHNLLVEVMKASGIMKTSQKWLFHTFWSVHYCLKRYPSEQNFSVQVSSLRRFFQEISFSFEFSKAGEKMYLTI